MPAEDPSATPGMSGLNSGRLELHHRHAIVAGYGPVGRLVVERLERAGVQVTLVDMNLQTVDRHGGPTRRCHHGDIGDEKVLREVGITSADALIVTIPDEQKAIETCQVARRLNPRIYIVARTNYLSRGLVARQVGADAVVVEEVVTAEAMQKLVTDALHI